MYLFEEKKVLEILLPPSSQFPDSCQNCRYVTLREKCPNTEFFLVRIFLHSNWIRRDAEYSDTYTCLNTRDTYSVRMRETADQKKTPYLDTFHAV